MRPIFDVGTIGSRNDFGALLGTRMLKSDRAVEIGTHQGLFAQVLLKRWTGTLHCVDPWLPGYDDEDPASHGDREADYRQAQTNLAKYKDRCHFLRMTSREASDRFAKDSLIFCYIDGKHRHDSVLEDLSLWWTRVIPGGLLAGHDIVCPNEIEGGWGREVQPAVLEFARAVNRTIYLVPELGAPWSYYLAK